MMRESLLEGVDGSKHRERREKMHKHHDFNPQLIIKRFVVR